MRALLVSLVACAACNDNLPIASFIDKLRVLAVQASPPEVAPGAVARLNPLVVEPEHPTGSTLSALWLTCQVDPGATSTVPCGIGVLDGTSLPRACASQADGTLCTLDTSLFSLVTPSRALLGGDGTGQLLITLVVTDDPAGATACYLGTLKNDGLPTEPDRCVIAYKVLEVSDPNRASTTANPVGPPNANPAFDAFVLVDADGTSQSLLSGDARTTFSRSTTHLTTRALDILAAAGSAERKADGTYEAISLSWFTDAGAIDGGRSEFDPSGCSSQTQCATEPPPLTATTSWNAPTSDEAVTQTNNGTTHFWSVLRDDRGGVAWQTGKATLSN